MNIGTISHGTLRTEDLLKSFSTELEHQVKKAAPHPGALNPDHMKLVNEARELLEADRIDGELPFGDELVNDLADALNEYAPPYFYFGSLEGDGSDFGYWLSDGALEDFDGLKVDDTSEVPADYTGEVLHVNDHGNATLYAADCGTLKEVWAIV